MTSKDQLKVIRAGFTIIRADEHNLLIKKKNDAQLHWAVAMSGFKSKAELQRQMKALLNNPKCIED